MLHTYPSEPLNTSLVRRNGNKLTADNCMGTRKCSVFPYDYGE